MRASTVVSSYSGEQATLQYGDTLFTIGMWLFAAAFGLLLYDARSTVVRVARARGAPVPAAAADATLLVLAFSLACLVLFGIASALFLLPSDASQEASVGLFVVSNVAFTAVNAAALVALWYEHVGAAAAAPTCSYQSATRAAALTAVNATLLTTKSPTDASWLASLGSRNSADAMPNSTRQARLKANTRSVASAAAAGTGAPRARATRTTVERAS